MEGLLTEIVGSLIDRAADFTIGQVAQDTTWKEWKSKNQLSKDDNDFLDTYIEAIVNYAKSDKPKELKNFFRRESVINAIQSHWYSEKISAPFFDSLKYLAKHFTVQEQIGNSYSVESEIELFEKTFRTSVRESASVIQREISDDVSKANKKLDDLLDKEKKLPHGFAFLKKPKEDKISSKKIKYQDYLESNNLPYVRRDTFLENNPSLDDFISEAFIVDNLLKDDADEGGIIFGEGGIGKTRLMLEIGQLALADGWVVIKVLPEARFIEDLLPALSDQEKYLLLFDYIEESRCFDSEVVSKLLRKNEELNIRALANCRYTYQASSNFPDTFLQIELKLSEAESKYKDYVVREITKELIQKFDVVNPDFFDIKPSFAVFLDFLLHKEKLETNDIREVRDFKAWIKKRFRITFEVSDFSKLEKEITYLISILPLKNKQIDLAYTSGYEDIIQRLKNNGWIEELEYKNVKILKVIHDTIADELLLIRLEIVRRDIKREVENIFNFASNYDAQFNWIRSFERIIEHALVSDKKIFYQTFQKTLASEKGKLIPIKSRIALTSLLEEEQRFNLINEDLDFFEDLVKNLSFAYPLSFSLNKAKSNANNKLILKELFTVWKENNPQFIKHFNVSFRVLSTYIKCFGIDDFSEKYIEDYVKNFLFNKESSFVFQSWLDNGGKLETVRTHVLDYLTKYDEDKNANFVLTAFLNNGGETAAIETHLLRYLAKHDTEKNASFIFKAWFDHGGKVETIQAHILNYVTKFNEDKTVRFVLAAFLTNGGKPEDIQVHVQNYLTKYIKGEDASYVLVVFLNNGGKLEVVHDYVLNYLAEYDEDKNANFVLTSFLNKGGKPETVQTHVLNYLEKNAEDESACFVFKSWFDNGGELEIVQTHVQTYLNKNDEEENAQFILSVFLNNGGKLEIVQTHIQNYLNKNDKEENAQFVLAAFLNNGGNPEFIQTHVLNYLAKYEEKENASFVFQAWFDNGGKPEVVQASVLNYLAKQAEEENASFVFQAWFDNGGAPKVVQTYVQSYLAKYDKEENAQFVLAAFLNNGGKPEAVQVHVQNYLVKYDKKENAQFVLAAFLNSGGKPEFIQTHVLNYLEQYDEDERASFVFQAWVENGGKPDVVQIHVQNYLAKYDKEENAQFVLGAFLSNGGKPEAVQTSVLNYLAIYDKAENAQFVLAAFLNSGGKPEAVHSHVLNYLAEYVENGNTSFVFQAWFNNGGELETIQTHILTYLAQYAEEENARFVLAAFLINGGKPEVIHPHVLTYLAKNAEDENASFVFKPWLDKGGSLEPIKDFFLKHLKANSQLENAAFHLAFWLKKGGDYLLIEDLIISYLDEYSGVSTAGILLNQLLRHNSFFKEKRAYYFKFLENNIFSNYSNNIIFFASKKLDDIHEFQSVVLLFLNEKVKEIDSQRIIATWINRQGDKSLIKDFMIQYLDVNAKFYDSQYVISAWLKNEGKLEVVQPFMNLYFEENSTKSNTGYVISSWLNAGGDPYEFLDYIKTWLSNKQPEFIANRVVACLFATKVIKNSYMELFEKP